MRRALLVTLSVLFVFAVVSLAGCKKEEAKNGTPTAKEEPAKDDGTPTAKEGPAVIEATRPEGADPVPEKTEPAAKVDALAAAFPKGKSALTGVDALKYLPADTLLLAVADNPKGLIEQLGWKLLTEKYRKWYEMGVAEVTQAVGHNILDPNNLAEIGIDATKPVGFAWLSLKQESFVVFGSLSSPDKFKTTVYSVAGRVGEKLEPRSFGDALVIAPRRDTEGCLVIIGDHVFFTFSDRGDEEGLALASRISTMVEKDSLAVSEKYKGLVEKLAFGKDFGVYVDIEAIAKAFVGYEGERMSDQGNWAQKELDRLKAENADPETIKEWEKRAAEEAEWQKKWQKRQEAESKLMKDLLGAIPGAVFGLELGEASLKMKAYTAVAEDSLVADMVEDGGGIPEFIGALSGKPLYLVSASINPKAYLQLIEQVIAAEGVDPAEMRVGLKAFTGLDLDEDIIGLLSGDWAFAVTGDLSGDLDEKKLLNALGGAALLSVTDEARAKEVIGKLAANELLKPLLSENKELGGYTFVVPEWKPVYIKVAGKYLGVSTDAAFFARVEKGENGDFLASVKNPELKALLTAEGKGATSMMDIGVFGLMFIAGGRGWSEPMAAEPAGVVMSEEYKKTKAEYEQVRKQVQELRDKLEADQQKLFMDIVNRIGTTAALGRKVEGGMVAYGGQYFGSKDLVTFISETADDALKVHELDEKRRSEVWRLEDKRWELERKLQDLRQRDELMEMEKKESKTGGELDGDFGGAIAPMPAPDAPGDGEAGVVGQGVAVPVPVPEPKPVKVSEDPVPVE